MNIIDTHAHLVCDELYPEVDEIIARAKAVGVNRILCICLSTMEVERAFLLKARYDFIDISLGFHPGDLNTITKEDWNALETLVQDDRIVAVGEIGLDYHWDDVERQAQKDAFIRQLDLAKRYHKPVLIHMRDACKDTMDILLQYLHVPGIMHCFSGSLETAKQAMKLGLYLSIGGPLTFKNARGLPELVAQIPLDYLLIETDCPYLTPHPHRGKRNEVMYITHTLEKLSDVKQVSKEELCCQLEDNYHRLFRM